MIIEEIAGWQEVSTNCSCEVLNEETNEYEFSDYCFGDCYQDAKYNLDELIAEWVMANNFNDYTLIRVEGSSIGWRNLNGYKDIECKDVAETLFLNGEFTVRYELSKANELTARRWSHDEPMGTGIFTFTKSPMEYCEICNELDEVTVIDETFERFSGQKVTISTAYCTFCYQNRGSNE